jgi:hypothetical protein
MTPEDQQKIRKRVSELWAPNDDKAATAGAILDLGDRIVGMLDGILRALRAIEDKLQPPQTVKEE